MNNDHDVSYVVLYTPEYVRLSDDMYNNSYV